MDYEWLPVSDTQLLMWFNNFRQMAAAQYSFTIFDRAGNVLWNVRTTERQAEMPADIAELETRTPYIWRLTCFSDDGRPKRHVWGMVTFLTPAEAADLQSDARDLRHSLAMFNDTPGGSASEQDKRQGQRRVYTAAIADIYRLHGVLMGAYDLLLAENMDLNPVYQEAGDLALAFLGLTQRTKGN